MASRKDRTPGEPDIKKTDKRPRPSERPRGIPEPLPDRTDGGGGDDQGYGPGIQPPSTPETTEE